MGRVRSKTRRMSYVSTVNRQQRQSYVICHVTFETLKLEPYIVTTRQDAEIEKLYHTVDKNARQLEKVGAILNVIGVPMEETEYKFITLPAPEARDSHSQTTYF